VYVTQGLLAPTVPNPLSGPCNNTSTTNSSICFMAADITWVSLMLAGKPLHPAYSAQLTSESCRTRVSLESCKMHHANRHQSGCRSPAKLARTPKLGCCSDLDGACKRCTAQQPTRDIDWTGICASDHQACNACCACTGLEYLCCQHALQI
jgi:hypothetical protein